MGRRIMMLCLLAVVLGLNPSCIERPWNKPLPLNKIYAKAGKLAAAEKYDEALALIEQTAKRVLAAKGRDTQLSAN